MAFFRFFYHIYVAMYTWYTLFLIRKATKAAAKLMRMVGKDPNYVPPPPAPVEVPLDDAAIGRAWLVDTKARANIWSVVNGYYIHHPKAHPILKLRAEYEEKQAKAAAQKAVKEAEAKATELAQKAIQTTEVGNEAIDSLRKAVHKIEEEVIEPEKKAS